MAAKLLSTIATTQPANKTLVHVVVVATIEPVC